MNKRILCLIFAAGCVVGPVRSLSAENITLTTYYPAPFGAYDRVKLVPRDSLPEDPNCNDQDDAGVLYYDNGKGEKAEGVYVCQKTGEDERERPEFEWVLVSRPFKEEPAKVFNHKVVCIKSDGKLGVCANNPSMDGTCACY